MVDFPNKPMGFPTKNDQHLGCFGGTIIYIYGNTHIKKQTKKISKNTKQM